MPIVPIDELNLLHSNLCRALGEPKRIQILYALADGPRHVTGLADDLDTPQSTISRHLSILRQCGLVRPEREGTSMIYHLEEPQIIEVVNAMRELLKRTVKRQSNLIG